MQKEVKFQTEEFVPEWASEYSEKKFTVFSTCFLSTKKNSHELDISEEVLRRDANSILGNFLVAKIEYGDSTTHLPDEIIYGYFPREQEIVFEEVEENGEKIVKACAYCVISKMYGKEFNEIFSYNNLRNTSVEMTVELPEDDEHNVQGFDIYGLTCLGMTVKGSCPDANMKMIRFSKEEAEDFFKSADESNLTPLQTFVKQRRKSMEDNTRKTTVVDKAEEGKEENAKMNEIAFVAVDIGDMWGKVFDALHDKYPDGNWGSVYRIDGIYEQDNKKFAIIHRKDEDVKYRLDFTLTEEGLTLADEITKVEFEIVETDEVKKFAEPENADKYKNFEEKAEAKKEDPEEDDEDDDDENDEEEEVEMSADEMKAEMAHLKSESEDKDNIIMECKTKMGEMEKELAELRDYKNACEKKELATSVESIMAEVKDCMAEDKYKEFRDEGLQCKMSELDAWSNKVKAFCFENGKVGKTSKKNEVFSFAAPVNPVFKKENGSVWERL